MLDMFDRFDKPWLRVLAAIITALVFLGVASIVYDRVYYDLLGNPKIVDCPKGEDTSWKRPQDICNQDLPPEEKRWLD